MAAPEQSIPTPLAQQPVPGQLSLIHYKESLAIIGDTKPWKENIKALGGHFNKGLVIENQKTAGWLIFEKGREAEISEFVQWVNSGRIQPLPPVDSSGRAGGTPQVQLSGPRARTAIGPRLQYQTITYQVVLPYIGQGAILTTGDGDPEKMLVVTGLMNDRPGVVDVITLKDGEQIVTGAVVSGVWEILDFGKDHVLTFH